MVEGRSRTAVILKPGWGLVIKFGRFSLPFFHGVCAIFLLDGWSLHARFASSSLHARIYINCRLCFWGMHQGVGVEMLKSFKIFKKSCRYF